MPRGRCVDCRRYFERRDDERWKTRCYSCWSERNREAEERRRKLREMEEREAPQPCPRCAELSAHLRALLMLSHPDRHGNSELATATTRWLLAQRDKLPRP